MSSTEVQKHLSVLGISSGSTKEEIKAAYHKQAKLWHPDLNKTAYAEKRFREVQLAAQALLDKQVRTVPAKYKDQVTS